MDDKTFEILEKLQLSSATLIKLKNFEDGRLLEVKKTRSFAEYCWTCTPSLIRYCLDTYSLDRCTYIDADTYYFSNAKIHLDEMDKVDASILLTEHRYTPKYDRSHQSGIYCVQYNSFRNDQKGRLALSWWEDRCIDWCFARFEDGKFGDQKYLDDWLTRFEGVHELKHIGGGVAPWNIQQYIITNENGKPHVNGLEVVFFHFHNLKYLGKSKFDLCRSFYKISDEAIKYLYLPYIKELLMSYNDIHEIDNTSKFDIAHFNLVKNIALSLLRKIRGTFYVLEI